MLSAQRGQLTNTGQAISEQTLPHTSERPVMRLLDGSVNIRKSSFSALLRQRLRIPGLDMGWGGAEKGGQGGCRATHLPDDLSL